MHDLLVSLEIHNGFWKFDDYWVGDKQKNNPLCKQLLIHLNSYHDCVDANSAAWMASYKKFSDPPWKELDPKKHIDLIWRLQTYANGADRYFNRIKGLPPVVDSGDRRRVTRFIDEGGKVLLWKARIFNSYNMPIHPAPAGEQTIVSLQYPTRGTVRCNNNPALSFGSTFIVTSDLSGPDPNVDAGTAALLASGQLFIYMDDLYLVTVTGSVLEMQTSTGAASWPYGGCDFRFMK